MKIELTKTTKEVRFDTLTRGTVFKHENDIYLRTSTAGSVNAVNLSTNLLACFGDGAQVEPIPEAKLVI